MKFIYGPQDFQNLERGEENCYLLTNGLGGFSSLTMIGSCSRNDHALFMCCEAQQAPNHRYNMIHRLEEVLCVGEKEIHLSSQNFSEEIRREEGFRYLSSFVFEEYPRWLWEVEGVSIAKKAVLCPGENTVGIAYELVNRSGQPVNFRVKAQMQFMPKGKQPAKEKVFSVTEEEGQWVISSEGKYLYLETNGSVMPFAQEVQEELYYAYDAVDGREAYGRTHANHQVVKTLAPEESFTLELVYSTARVKRTAAEIERILVWENQKKIAAAGLMDDTANALVLAADQFTARRASTGGSTILAGFPFFEDWGRDTMIALNGCCISTGQFERAKSILRTFAGYCREGLMPNLFPEGETKPAYNTADAALLFLIAVYNYYMKTGKLTFVEELWPVMSEIIDCYEKGTEYHIFMDEDGLLCAGGELEQVTWMDVRIGDILPTPRHGKPVEINAYWYNGLCIMNYFNGLLGAKKKKDYGAMAEKCRKSFCEKFWMEKKGYLRDLVSGKKQDEQLRCNQIWAISLPFSLLSLEKEKQVVETVYRKLYTPMGLRTLEPADEEFHPQYGGSVTERDMAYHQGTVWTYPLGAYYLAYLKVNGYRPEAKTYVRRQLQAITVALREGCIGQLPEIYDGLRPVSSKGCFAQAWSVGELLRVYEALER